MRDARRQQNVEKRSVLTRRGKGKNINYVTEVSSCSALYRSVSDEVIIRAQPKKKKSGVVPFVVGAH